MDVYQVLGLIGGFMFPIATAAQTWKTIATQSAEDISYGWQFLYAIAESLYIIYSWHFRLWAFFIPCVTELSFMVVMILAKFYFENVRPALLGRKAERNIALTSSEPLHPQETHP